MESISKEKIDRTISGGKGDFTLNRKEIPEFSDKNVKKIFFEVVR